MQNFTSSAALIDAVISSFLTNNGEEFEANNDLESLRSEGFAIEGDLFTFEALYHGVKMIGVINPNPAPFGRDAGLAVYYAHDLRVSPCFSESGFLSEAPAEPSMTPAFQCGLDGRVWNRMNHAESTAVGALDRGHKIALILKHCYE